MLSTSEQAHTSADDEQSQSQAICLCRKALAESPREPGNTNSSAAGQGQVEPSQLSAQAVTPAEGAWLNRGHTAKTDGESEHLASHSLSGGARLSV